MCTPRWTFLISRQMTGSNLFGKWLHLSLHHFQQLGILESLSKWNESLTSDNTRFSTILFLPYFLCKLVHWHLCYFSFYSNVNFSLYFTEIFVFRGPLVDWSSWNISYCSIYYNYCSITFINLQSLSIEAAFTKDNKSRFVESQLCSLRERGNGIDSLSFRNVFIK